MTALGRFNERQKRNPGRTALIIGGVAVVVGTLAGYAAGSLVDRGYGRVAELQADILSRVNDPAGSRNDAASVKALADMEKATLAKKESMVAATDALRRMAEAADPKSKAYPAGHAGIEARERDFVTASNDYAAAVAKLEPKDEAEILSDRKAGPNTSFKVDELSFSLDALEALGGDVDRARAEGSFRP
ncbi:hypothetical protein OIU34_22785 [Pararhizobium sp. BT-229]|uniref:hypothetical protein n=1 Tax=Pararhizobium sp. BT-229 TaxID=2986923 RepID=UPI0021F79DDC|nr:hypothetical protein [Pararhizobium sp. BT-229]MCV9964721.1 hypothetical protein [Pararhizobium sp. BT-229]